MLITASELAAVVSDADTVVFDCRFRLGDPTDGRNRYLAGHIPGAYYLDLEQDLSGPKQAHGGRHPLPDPQQLADKLSAAGVTKTARVVVYDDGEGMAPRAWWLIRYLGHEHCVILDGGYRAWLAQGLPTDTTIPQPRPGDFPLSIHRDWIVSTADIEKMVYQPGAATLVDARAPERYRGDVEPIDPVAGHIPHAVNRPWTDGVNEDGTWKSPEHQRSRFQNLGRPTDVVMYCGSGVTACANLFAMELAGLSGAKLYPGSWSDWCSYPDHPVETGDAGTDRNEQ